MLKHGEKKQVREILKLLEEPDIVQLAKTVTLNKLEPKSIKEAVDIILRYESSFQSFLQHKKVSREVLFQFMHLQKIPVLPKDDKKSMITKIINFLQNSHSSPKHVAGTKHENVKSEAVSNQCNQQQMPDENLNGEQFCHRQQTVRVSSSESIQLSEQYRRTEGNVNDLAIEFSKWFYSMMNQESRIDIEHFWADCSVKVHISANGDNVDDSIAYGAEDSVQLLWEVKMQHRLFFNPNITPEGVRGIVEVHGLVMVLACGSLHKEQKCVGVFEQKFGLIRDPTAQNNWKIKFTELFLRSTDTITALPTLQESELISNSSISSAY